MTTLFEQQNRNNAFSLAKLLKENIQDLQNQNEDLHCELSSIIDFILNKAPLTSECLQKLIQKNEENFVLSFQSFLQNIADNEPVLQQQNSVELINNNQEDSLMFLSEYQMLLDKKKQSKQKSKEESQRILTESIMNENYSLYQPIVQQQKDNLVLKQQEEFKNNHQAQSDMLENNIIMPAKDSFTQSISMFFDKQIREKVMSGEELCQITSNAKTLSRMLKSALNDIAKENSHYSYFSKAQIRLFGSVKASLALKNSDLDLLIEFDQQVSESTVFDLLNTRLKQNFGVWIHIKNVIKNARVPFIILEYRTPVQQYLQSGENILCGASDQAVSVDLIINDVKGYYHALLFRTYAKYCRQFRKLALLLKIWGKKNNVIGPTQMSSFSITLLLIDFMQRKKYLPILQLINRNNNNNENKNYLKKICYPKVNQNDMLYSKAAVADIWFETEIDKIKEYAQQKNLIDCSNIPTAELLANFFQDVCQQLNTEYPNKYQIRIDGKFPVQVQNTNLLFSFADPFCSSYDPGQRSYTSQNSTRDKMRAIFKQTNKAFQQKDRSQIVSLFN